MSFPSIVPGTASLAYSGGTTPAAGVFLLSDTGGLGHPVAAALAAVDFTKQPAILLVLGFSSLAPYTGGASASIGGVPMSVIIDSVGPDGGGHYLHTVACLLCFDATTVFSSGDMTILTPGTGTGGPPFAFGAAGQLRLMYYVDPVINFGFGAGFTGAGNVGADVLATPTVAGITGDYAIAMWSNSANAGNSGYVITDPTISLVATTSGGFNGSVSAYNLPADGPYSARAHRSSVGTAWWAGASVLLALLRGAPPSAVFVPNTIGDTLSVGEAAVIAVGLVVGAVTTMGSFTVAPGIILSTNPPPGAETLTGHAVNFVISSGTPPLWTITPDWATPVREKLGFLTDVMRAWSGYEQRRILRVAPRRVFTFSTLAQDKEKRYLENALFDWSAEVWYLPIFPDGQHLPSAVGIGDTAIACDTVHRDFVNGGLAIAIKDALTVEVFLLSTITSGALNLSAPATAIWPVGTRLYPLRSARLLVYPKLLHDSQEMWSVSIEFTVNEPCDWPAASGLPVYRTLPVLEDSPDVSTPPAGDYSREANLIDSVTGALEVDDTAQLGFPGGVHQWYLKGRTARAAFRSLLYLLKGRAAMIWVPSYNADLLLIGTLGSSAVAMTVQACGLVKLAGIQNRRDIRIELTGAGIYYRRIIAVAAGMSSATEVATLDSALGVAIAASQVRRISWMVLSRSDADEIEIQHLAMADGLATAQTRFVAVNYET